MKTICKSTIFYIALVILFQLVAIIKCGIVANDIISGGPFNFGVPTSSGAYFITSLSNIIYFCQNTMSISSCSKSITTSHSGKISITATSADDSLLATGGYDYKLLVYYTGNSSLKCSFKHDNRITAIKFDPTNNDILYSGGYDNYVRKWNTSSCSAITQIQLTNNIWAMDIKPDGTALMVSDRSNTNRNVYILTSGLALSNNGTTHTLGVIRIFYIGTGAYAVTIGEDSRMVLINGATIVTTYTPVFAWRGSDCYPFLQKNPLYSDFYLACIDSNGYFSVFQITTTSIDKIFTYQSGKNYPLWIIGNLINPVEIQFIFAYSTFIRTVQIQESSGNNCFSTYFYKNTSNVCTFCYRDNPHCLACSSSTSCSTCMDGYYRTGSTCNQCSSPCSLCSNSNNCDACFAQFQLQGSNCQAPVSNKVGCIQFTVNNHKCQQCQKGYFKLPSDMCQQCNQTMSNCLQCTASNTCTSCETGYYIPSSSNGCILCSSPMPGCLICYDSNNCYKCAVAFKIVGSYIQCSNCHQTCATCMQYYYDDCLTCRATDNRTLTGTKCPCSYGHLQITLNNPCPACIDYLTKCQTCSSSTVCTLCLPHYFFITRSGKKQCQVCISTCASCSINYNNCTSCDSANFHRTLSGTNCVCQSGYVDNGTDPCYGCGDLMIGCSACSNQTMCTTCNAGYVLRVISAGNQDCVTCPYYCNTCIYVGATLQCTSCPAFSFRTYNATGTPNRCPCDTGYFDDNNTVVCQTCSLILINCLTCNSRSNCLSCSPGLNLDKQHRSCQSCKTTCLTCGTYFDECSSCNAADFRTLINNQCVCNSSSYSEINSTVCKSCSSRIAGCDQCNSNGKCTSCLPGYTLSQDLTQCYQCSALINGCLSCSSQKVCLSCINPFTLINKKCACPADKYTSKNFWGTCQQYKIKGLTSKLNVQMQVHQHQSNKAFVFLRFRAFQLTLINTTTLQNSFNLYLNNQLLTGVIASRQNNRVKLQVDLPANNISTNLYNPQFLVEFKKNIFYNQKSQTLHFLNYSSTPRRFYHYDDSLNQTLSSMNSVLKTIMNIFKWIFFGFFILGFVRWFYPAIIFIQIIPIFLFLLMSLPANISAVLQGFLSFQNKCISPLGDFSAWMDIYFPPLALHYYGISGYILFTKLFDILMIGLVVGMTKFDDGIIRMFPLGVIRTYLRQSLTKKGYAVRSISILALLPSFVVLAGAFIVSRDFSTQAQLFNFVCCLMVFGFFIIYIFNHSSTLRQAKQIRNIKTQDCYLGLNYQDQKAANVVLIHHITQMWYPGAIFLLQLQVYFTIGLILQIITFIAHCNQGLYINIWHMILRLSAQILFILFIISMFVFRLAQWAFVFDHDTAYLLGTLTCVIVFLYLTVIIVEKIIVVFLPNKNTFQKKIANATQLTFQISRKNVEQDGHQKLNTNFISKNVFLAKDPNNKNNTSTTSPFNNLNGNSQSNFPFGNSEANIGFNSLGPSTGLISSKNLNNKLSSSAINKGLKLKYARQSKNLKGFLQLRQVVNKNKNVIDEQGEDHLQ